MRPLPAPLLIVTDRHQARLPLLEAVSGICAAGGRWIWFRDRDMEPNERRTLAKALSGIAMQSGATLTVGGDSQLAMDIGAEGVHLPSRAPVREARRRLGPKALIGVSAHNLGDVLRSKEAGADYVTLSPIYSSASKPGYGPPLGLHALGAATATGIPVIALGGITPAHAEACRRAGASGVAVMGELMRSNNPERTISALVGSG